jgi:hypothetical protein
MMPNGHFSNSCDLLIYAAVSAGLIGAVSAASYVRALRATAVDRLDALQAD